VTSAVELLVSPERFSSYLKAAGGDRDRAVALYEWNVSLAGACFEAFHYVEIIVRNAIDRELRTHFAEERRGIPWFLLPAPGKHQATFAESIERVRKRLRDQGPQRETRDQILAGVDFGFWTSLLHSENEELWRQALRKAFPHSSGKRKDVVAALEALRIFRNKLAHHDSLLAVDVSFKLAQMRDVLRWVDPDGEQWLAGKERIAEINAARPLARPDTVVVAAKDAWPLYLAVGAYLCQAGRAFPPVNYLAFYADKEIKPEVARILRRLDNVDWTQAEANRLQGSTDPGDHRLALLITQTRALGWREGRYQVFDLTMQGQPGHATLPSAIRHTASGKGSAFTQGQRYVVREALTEAATTADLA
jgi:hypothetical protein